MAEASNARNTVLECIMASSRGGTEPFRIEAVFNGIAKRGESRTDMLICWHDLLRAGIVAMANPETPEKNAYFVTEPGRKTLEHASRDPINQDGYMIYLDNEVKLDPVTRAYVEEALSTYRSCCYKATAVMIGAAIENLVFDLRDVLIPLLSAKSISFPKLKDLQHAGPTLEAIEQRVVADMQRVFASTKDDALRKLLEDAEARLLPLASDFRKLRNSAGHPASLDPILPADVHCNLLLFPAAAKLFGRLKAWIVGHYV